MMIDRAFSYRGTLTVLRALLFMGLLGLTAPGAGAKPPKMLDIADTVAANPILTKLSAMIQASDMGTFLSSRGPFTIFAPTDSAFAQLPPGTLEALLRPENKERLQHILLFHVINGKKWSAKDLQTATTLLSCEGSPLTIKKSKLGVQFVMKAKIVHADIRCQNGVINEVDTLLMPPESALPPIAAPMLIAPPIATNAAPVTTPTPSTSPTNSPDAIPVAPAVAPAAQ
jgi:uncharacterized surface protein with fasciclin (FAS1) repeats